MIIRSRCPRVKVDSGLLKLLHDRDPELVINIISLFFKARYS